MKVTIKLIGCLEICSDAHEWQLHPEAGVSLYDILRDWVPQVPPNLRKRITSPEDAGTFTGFYLVCNNKHVNLHEIKDTIVEADSVITIVSPIAGG